MKVEEGQRINVGEIISDRTSERTKLQAKKQRLETAIARLDEAKLNYQKQQYEYSLKVSDYQTSLQKQQE